MKIKYTLRPMPGYIRVFRVSDMAQLGVEVDDEVRFEQSNNWTLDLPQDAAEALVTALPNEFSLETDEAEAGPSADSVDSSIEQPPLSVPDASQANPAALTDESGEAPPKDR